MLIGVPKEIKANENRVGLTPISVREFINAGHQVIVEKNAGQGIGKTDSDYQQAGATVVDTAAEIFAKAEMVIKVKEPQAVEYEQLRPDQILFTYLHLSPDVAQTQGLIKSGCIAVAYETVTSNQGSLPLLAPMSEVAGRMAVQVGAYALQKAEGGAGVLLGGVPGVESAKVVVLGGGVAGFNATKMAVGMGAEVIVIDRNVERLRYIDDIYQGRVKTLYSTADSVYKATTAADLVIGTVLIPGANAPKLVTHEIMQQMKPGAVIVDVAIDQGGCTDASKPTTHENPTYLVDDIVLYCVANMPGGVPKTSTYALNNATLPFALAIANKGVKQALLDDKHLRNGLNVCQGKLTYRAVAEAQGLDYVSAETALAAL
ncbi:alanine dehydrogenase [Ostreibacterium oceani]|uniref:Alanine dehydrogenase n=1 Tax=Ostreibacterium oceani TaxID=2654998 RepID=A0A6N7EYK4_9GAMM|nr:alanine dehydrogenase [Ostreibacterium oceani]MPV86635.1 alanine dehydrogenase [Ostreibacterium oceani]